MAAAYVVEDVGVAGQHERTPAGQPFADQLSSSCVDELGVPAEVLAVRRDRGRVGLG